MLSAAVWLMLSSMLTSLRISGGGSFPKPLTAEEERIYLKRSAEGDLEARNILIERNLRLVAHIMKKYYSQSADQEDLISIGTIGLIKGISTFDASKGARLATYAARCVENEILMYFRSMKKTAGDVSLSDCIETGRDGNALSLMDVLCSDEDLFEDLSARQTYKKLYEVMNEVLSERERMVITLRYGLGDRTPLTPQSAASAGRMCPASRKRPLPRFSRHCRTTRRRHRCRTTLYNAAANRYNDRKDSSRQERVPCGIMLQWQRRSDLRTQQFCRCGSWSLCRNTAGSVRRTSAAITAFSRPVRR